jgi:hypothetical protein
MTGPDSYPVEDARKKFADILDGTQFRSTHTQITRRGKTAGYVVPPEWYDRASGALEENVILRRKLEELSASSAPPAPPREPRRAPTARRQTAPPQPEPSVEGRPLSDEEAKTLAKLARSRATTLQIQALDQITEGKNDGIKAYAEVSEGLSMGLLTHDEVYGERPDEEPTT